MLVKIVCCICSFQSFLFHEQLKSKHTYVMEEEKENFKCSDTWAKATRSQSHHRKKLRELFSMFHIQCSDNHSFRYIDTAFNHIWYICKTDRFELEQLMLFHQACVVAEYHMYAKRNSSKIGRFLGQIITVNISYLYLCNGKQLILLSIKKIFFQSFLHNILSVEYG